MTERKYRNQLEPLGEGCPALEQRLRNLPYEKEAVKRLVSEYNECVAPNSNSFVREHRGLHIEPGVFGGVAVVPMSYDFPEATVSFRRSESLALGLSITIQRREHRWRNALALDATWQYVHSSGLESYEESAAQKICTPDFQGQQQCTSWTIDHHIRDMQVSGHFLELGMAYQRKLRYGSWEPFFRIGLIFSLTTGYDSFARHEVWHTSYRDETVTSEEYSTYTTDLPQGAGATMGLQTGLGVAFGKLWIGARALAGSPVGDATRRLLLGYRF